MELNKMHTGDLFTEKHRVVSSGGRVAGGVVNGKGKMARALGVHGGKGIIPHPDVITFRLDVDTVWPTIGSMHRVRGADVACFHQVNVVVACSSGVWDSVNASRMAKEVGQLLQYQPAITASAIAKHIRSVAQTDHTAPCAAVILVAILRCVQQVACLFKYYSCSKNEVCILFYRPRPERGGSIASAPAAMGYAALRRESSASVIENTAFPNENVRRSSVTSRGTLSGN